MSLFVHSPPIFFRASFQKIFCRQAIRASAINKLATRTGCTFFFYFRKTQEDKQAQEQHPRFHKKTE